MLPLTKFSYFFVNHFVNRAFFIVLYKGGLKVTVKQTYMVNKLTN